MVPTLAMLAIEWQVIVNISSLKLSCLEACAILNRREGVFPEKPMGWLEIAATGNGGGVLITKSFI